MLRKLLKHEFRATARVMLPLYLVTVLLALMARGADLWWGQAQDPDNVIMLVQGGTVMNILTFLVNTGFVLALMATFLVAVILAILRFRSNLMADEGYVMFTLPVSTHSLVWSKLIVSAVWFFGALVVDVVAVVTLVANLDLFQELGRTIQEMMEVITGYYVGNGIAFLVELLVLFLVSSFVCCLVFYTPLAIGHGFNRHKMLLSVVFFFVIQIVTNLIAGLGVSVGLPVVEECWIGIQAMGPEMAIHASLLFGIALQAVYGAVLYLITIRMLHRHLNLE